MKLKINILFFIIILCIFSFLLGCNRSLNDLVDSTTEVDQDTIETPEPTLTKEAIKSKELTHTPEIIISETPVKLPSETPVLPSNTPTKTPIGTNTPASQETQVPILTLNYCRETDDQICIGSFLSVSDKLGMVLLKPNNQDESYILFDDQEYNCGAIPGFNDRYFCTGLPNQTNRIVLIQIFEVGSTTPLAAGEIFIQEPLSQTEPTEVPKPPDPYTP